MFKLLLNTALLLLLSISACQSAPAPTAQKSQGTLLGDTGIHVSGTVQAGASTTVH